VAVGGAGGLGGPVVPGGAAGQGVGGGIALFGLGGALDSVSGSTITGNAAVGGLGGGGGLQGGGGTGGDGDGGGLFAGTGVVVALDSDSITANQAVAGGAGTPRFGGPCGRARPSVG